jgi:hypothetical protein
MKSLLAKEGEEFSVYNTMIDELINVVTIASLIPINVP